MGSQRFFHFILVIGTVLTMMGTLLFFKQGSIPFAASNHHSLIVQNTNSYLGPKEKIPGNPQLIRVQVLVNDDPSPQGVQILEAEFDQIDIPLKPRDVYGFRGQASFQKAPGKYMLRWRVKRDSFAWPRTVSHEEEVNLDPRDLWIQITITGNTAAIS